MIGAFQEQAREMPPVSAGTSGHTGASPARVRSPMVLHARVVTGNGGGPEKTILNSPRFLTKLGYQSRLAYLHPPGDPGILALQERGKALGAEVISIPDKGAFDLSVIWKTIRLCRELKVDIWHGHDYKSNLLGLLVRPFHRMQLVTTLHGWTNLSGRMPLYVQLDKWCLKYYQALICVSDDLAEACRQAHVPADRIRLVYNAIDTQDYRRRMTIAEAKLQLGAPEDGLLIGAVGRLSPEKGFDLLIRAVNLLRQAGRPLHLWIAGDGESRADLERLVAELHCEAYVQLLGHVTDPKLFYQAMDVYALSSVREGLPNVVLEAMAMEVPVVATRVNGVPTLLGDDQTGLIVEPGCVNALADAIDRIIADPKLAQQFGEAGRQRVEGRFSFAWRMEKVVSIYDEVLNVQAGL